MATLAHRPARTPLQAERIFFLSMMAALLVLVAWGFAPSFYLRHWLAPPPTHIDRPGWFGWTFIIHGVLFTLWMLLFCVQTILIGSKRLRWHKQIGKAVYPLYFAMIAVGTFVGFLGAKYGFHDVPFDSLTFSALPWIVLAVFALLGWAGIHERKDPQRHKRLMLLATIAIADAGIARVTVFQHFLPPWLDPTVFMIVPLIAWDMATLHRVHRTTVRGGLLVAAALLLSVPVGMTRPWHMLVGSVLGLHGVPSGQFVS